MSPSIPASSSPKCFLQTAIGNSSISELQRQLSGPLCLAHASGNPEIPSNKEPSVALRSYCADIRFIRYSQNGNAIELPNALYFGLSASLCFLPLLSVQSPMSTHPSGKPCNLVHSNGVSRLTTLFTDSSSSPINIGFS